MWIKLTHNVHSHSALHGLKAYLHNLFNIAPSTLVLCTVLCVIMHVIFNMLQIRACAVCVLSIILDVTNLCVTCVCLLFVMCYDNALFISNVLALPVYQCCTQLEY